MTCAVRQNQRIAEPRPQVGATSLVTEAMPKTVFTVRAVTPERAAKLLSAELKKAAAESPSTTTTNLSNTRMLRFLAKWYARRKYGWAEDVNAATHEINSKAATKRVAQMRVRK